MASEPVKSSFCDTSKLVDKLVSQHWSCIDPKGFELVKDLRHYATECQPSQLTTFGFEQHRRIGKFLKTKYSHLLKKSPILKTTKYSRTLLSLLSMLHQLWPSWCSRKTQIKLAESIYFSKLDCPAIDLLKSVRPNITERDWSSDLKYIQKLFEDPDSEEDNWESRKNPETVGDYIMSKYCHDSVLPKVKSI